MDRLDRHWTDNEQMYRKRTIISLYIFYTIFKTISLFLMSLFQKNLSLYMVSIQNLAGYDSVHTVVAIQTQYFYITGKKKTGMIFDTLTISDYKYILFFLGWLDPVTLCCSSRSLKSCWIVGWKWSIYSSWNIKWSYPPVVCSIRKQT